jgi:hypothetical protein
LQEVLAEHMIKWGKGNDLWVAVLVEPSTKPSSLVDQYLLNGVPDRINALIQDYDTIFQTLVALPPSRTYDHSITLLPNSTPVNCRPYRYSPRQKNEIERHVEDMLKAATIIPSLSPFASPVLLVKKKDDL